MPISEKAFNGLKGTSTHTGANPNSRMQRILRVLADGQGYTSAEVMKAMDKPADGKEETKKQINMAIGNLCYRTVKNGNGDRVTKVLRRNNDDGVAFYKRNPDHNQEGENFPSLYLPLGGNIMNKITEFLVGAGMTALIVDITINWIIYIKWLGG